MPRLFGSYREREGVAHRRHFAVIEADLGPLTGLARSEAWRTAALAVEADLATMALADARRRRRLGKGRVPSAREVERRARRAGLANVSYSQALDRLRELAAKNGHALDVARAIMMAEQAKGAAP